MNDPRGSIWRKWDLHIHTPASFHWNGGKRFCEMTAAEKKAALDEIIQRIGQSDIASFGIMDYWTFDGYWALRDHLALKGQALNKTVFPGMELRIEAPVDFRLNIQVILSDTLTKQDLQDFKGALTLMIGGTERPLSDESLVAFARTLDHSKAAIHGFAPEDLTVEAKLVQLGSMTAKITRQSLNKALERVPVRTCLIIMPYDVSDGLRNLDWACSSSTY